MRIAFGIGIIVAMTLLLGWAIRVPRGEAAEKPRRSVGIDQRIPWTTSHVRGSPEPPPPYRLENAFPKLRFEEPLDLVLAPGTNQWVVAERHGKLFTFTNSPETDRKDLLLDVGRTVYGVALHPDFARNGYVYVTSIRAGDAADGSRLSRYTVTRFDPMHADPTSEVVILTWPSGGHNGGGVRFGPDGFLYLGTGDGSGIADSLETGQNPGDLLGAILRIDVNTTASGKAYAVPPDNPFAQAPSARPEIWAYGLRQPWRFSFDPASGDLWVGEIGQDLWESVLRVEKGGNYGWSVREGTHPFRPERPQGPTPVRDPIVEHSHTDFRSITGGYVYHGRRLPALAGAYLYGDFDTGKVWMLRYDRAAKRATDHRELTDSQLRIVSWGEDRAGELFALDFTGGGVYRLVPTPQSTTKAPAFPRKLSETGLFASTKEHIPAAGVIPYSVNAELWSDGAVKERFLALPGMSKIEFDSITYPQPAPGAPSGWRFPDGTVLVKTFFLESEPGNPSTRRRLETRLLHFEQTPGTEEYGDQVWNGYTYVWNDDQTDAELLGAQGLDRTYTLTDSKAPGGKRTQVYHFPSRAECALCHNVAAKYALGVNTPQMNRDHNYGGVIANQLTTLAHLGMFTKPLPAAPEQFARLADYHDQTQSLEARARSYLHANCAHCHRKWGGGNAEFQLLATQPLVDSGSIGARPGHGTFDLSDPRIVAPGDPKRSLVLYRMEKLGLGRMPHIASNVVDAKGAVLVREWIQRMK